jgi:hypothetical protein
MKRLLAAVLPALLVVSLGVSLEWVLLTGSTPQAVYKASLPPPPQPIYAHLAPDFQTGVIFPQWGTTAYSDSNSNWLYGLGEVHDQTGAGWVEIPINLYQAQFTDTTLSPSPQTPSPESMEEGIRAAHAHGYHVFVVPFLTVRPPDNNPDGHWAGDLGHHDASIGSYSIVLTRRWRQAWFDGYWQAIAPYLDAAAVAGAEQFAIGTEFEFLEQGNDALWNTLIARAHAIYPGALTYDMNWTAACAYTKTCVGKVIAFPALPAWMQNPALTYLGVSEYRPLTARPQPHDADTLAAVWHLRIKLDLDTLSALAGKPVVLSEIGYRDAADALYMPWLWQSTAPADPQLQAAAYEAALENVVGEADPHIAGIYFWGWSVPGFKPNWLPAADVLHKWYTQPRAASQDSAYGYTWPAGRTTSS